MVNLLRWSVMTLLAFAMVSTASAQEQRVGRRVDLLKAVKLPEDGVGGTWKKTPESEVHSDSREPARLRLGKVPEGEYDLVVTFVRQEGRGRVGLVLAYDGSSFGWFLGEGRDRKAAGFALVNGHGTWESEGATGANVAADDKAHTVRIKVRKEGVAAWVDRKKTSQVADYASLTLKDGYSVGEDMLGLVSDSPSILIHSVWLIPYSEAVQEREKPTPRKEKSGRPIREPDRAADVLTQDSVWTGSKGDNNSDTNACTLRVNERTENRAVVEIRCGREHIVWTFAIKGKQLVSTGFQDLSGQGLRTDAAASGTLDGRTLFFRYQWTYSSKKRKNNLVMGELQFERSE